MSVNVQGRYAYVGLYGADEVGIYDICNQASPTTVGTVNNGASSGPMALDVQGRYAYVADWDDGNMNVYDLGGSLTSQFEAGGVSTNSLSVNGNSNFTGDVNASGSISIGGSANIAGNLGASGQVSFQNATNSTSAFQVQNAGVAHLFNVDTTDSSLQLGAAVSATAPSGGGTLSSWDYWNFFAGGHR